MLVWFGRKTKVAAVEGGRVKRGQCPQCGEDARFRECVVTKTWTAYSVLDLADTEQRLFRCSACAELFEIEDRQDPVAEAKLRELRARKAKLEMALRAKQRKAAADDKRHAANIELARLKEKMGL